MEELARRDGNRMDIYRGIHKALRAYMSDTLVKLAALDLDDAAESRAVLQQVRDLAQFCAEHLQHENDFVHAAMEARRPGSAAQTAGDHVHHLEEIAELTRLADAVEQAAPAEQHLALCRLQATLGVFVGENFTHMNVEETHNNQVLWETHTDAELLGVEQAIVASLSPQEMQSSMRWMLIGMNPSERAQMLQGIRQDAPPPAFAGIIEIARTSLPARDFAKLERALATAQPLAA